ncbi:MAG: S24 family peptidase [Deltaproteobacteria bacterium]|jgi:phage repressor protein C with HTH and peptisase S24 domain|nr:S24 family peptidase [Deltaproteobacteria bacterium]
MNRSQSFAVVNYLLNHKGMSKEEIAKAAGVSKRMVDYTLAGGLKQIGSKSIMRIADHLGLTLAQLLPAALAEASDFPAYDDLIFVRKMAARPRGGDETEDGFHTRYSFRRDWINTRGIPDEMRLFDVVGDSMAPTIAEGDMVLVDQSQNQEWAPGRIYLITLNDAFMIKRAGMRPGFYALQSDNKDKVSHPDISVSVESPDYFMVHGRVIWSCREF